MARPEEPEEDRVHRLRKALEAAKRESPEPKKIDVYRVEFGKPGAKWSDPDVDRLFKKIGRRDAEGRPLDDEEPLPADLDAELDRFYGFKDRKRREAEEALPGLLAEAKRLELPTELDPLHNAIVSMRQELADLAQVVKYSGDARLAMLIESSDSKEAAVAAYRQAKKDFPVLRRAIQIAEALAGALGELGPQ